MKDLDMGKLKRLVHYICHKCDKPASFGSTKLNKVLWYADALAYTHLGESITGDAYVKRQFGPVPKHILRALGELMKQGDLVVRKFPKGSMRSDQYISLQDPDISAFTAEQISLVDEVFDQITENYTARSISDLTHTDIWKATPIGEEIPLRAILLSDIGEVTENEIAWAQEVGREFYARKQEANA